MNSSSEIKQNQNEIKMKNLISLSKLNKFKLGINQKVVTVKQRKNSSAVILTQNIT